MKKMKNRLFIVSILALSLFATTACTNWLDTRPESEMILDEYWTTESEAEAVLMAAYRGFITSDCTYRMLVWGELRSDNFTQGTGIGDEINKVLRQEITPSTPYTTWSSFYSVINYCNTFLSFAPDVLKKDDNFTVEKLRKLSAEAYAVRALAYFYLVRAFQNVPWISEPSLDDTQDFIVPQFSERAVLDSIIRDLELYSLPYIPRIHSTDKETKGRFTKNGVYALLADIYLWDNQFEKCSQMCDYILADDYYTLVPAENFYSQVFYSGFSSESIFEFGYDNNIQVNDATRSLYGYQNNQNGQLAFPVTLVSGQYSPFEYPAGSYIESKNDVDIRWKDFFVNDPGVGVYQIFKYAGIQRTENFDGSRSTYSYRNNTSNWIVYRLPDIILMKAEAVLQGKQEEGLAEALSLVNMTYSRSNAGDTLSLDYYDNSYDKLVELVLRERQRELMFEGKRWFDLMRMARRAGSPAPLVSFIARKGEGSEALGKMSQMNALYWPVNKGELEANTALVQNKFYETESTASTLK
jgi:hypothetical protein